MYLKRLEISGFKSFANKTVLDFLPDRSMAEGASCGITAIVGPNGSGKSNIADAIRWAIGEQSSKNLRGKKSEDVIFAGTEGKARMGSAAVTLHFDNSDKRIPIEFSDVSVTRKIYRSGESEYAINGNKVRLLDIVDLLAKAGIGKDSYCVITQGMSDAVLSASPLERRSIFEDAAGVKQYQIEKERAIRKLENTKDNLARVDALTIEIEPHLKNLKRQAEKASQGKDVAAKLHEKQLLLYGFLWRQFEGERGTLKQDRETGEKTIASLEEQSVVLREAVAALSAALEDQGEEEGWQREAQALRALQNQLSRERSIIEGKIEIEKERVKEKEVVETIPVDLAFVKRSVEKIGSDQAGLIERIQGAERIEDLQDIREFAQVIKQELYELAENAGRGSVRETRIIGPSPEEKAESDARVAGFQTELVSIGERISQAEAGIAEKEKQITEHREANKANREMFFMKEKESRECERALQQLKDNFNELKVRLARIEVREEDLTALVREELSMKPEELSYDGVTPVDRERMEREIGRLKVEVEHIGTIDPLVVDEYEETAKRFEFLTHESADLKQAMESLRSVIKEMDVKIDEAFEKTFGEIKQRFAHYFKIIFGGGKADIEKVRIALRRRSADIEEEGGETPDGEEEKDGVGIEIFACPPGKKITNLSMLSGGERSLTSLALLFAIISHNPPPFAVLDEVEAALDEANSRRFSKMLQELSDHTQFIAITHNRETMSQAGLLYGVTMQRDGISQLLSVRLDQIGEKGQLSG
ncbi:MAG: AAA family ATPase [Candidatus Moranbacteria bacterium]|nr:AAA family ATPase [Candidatus Moranbacteria bacterium]MBP6034312.1 AAA family ATPase [Candidatus Moranbacteria bacterium]MBP7696001.1 AAA family ATPase [Candidatus Moranbacteria bacterium]